MNTTFDTYRYIYKRMKACKVPSNARSCDCDERILSIANRALKPHWISGKRTEELMFSQVGDVWVSSLSSLRRI